MAKLIDTIRKRSRDSRRSVVVPEWGDVELFFGPLTTADMEAVEERMRAQDGLEPEKHTNLKRLHLIIRKAELEDGTRAFEIGDLHDLKESADWTIIQRLTAFMYQASARVTSHEEAKKKSEGTEDSDSD